MIHVACNIDSNYVKHCGVMLTSLFENNKAYKFNIHIVESNLSQDNKKVLTSIVEKYGNLVSFYKMDIGLIDGFEIKATHNRLSLAAYFRCFLSLILPVTINRVIYFDCDIIIKGDISPFWSIEMEDTIAVAAVEDMGCQESHRYEILKYPMHYSYFNSGVLLVNLEFWRKNNIPQRCIDFYHKYPERIIFNDQDLLNCILYKNKKLVSIYWNVQDAFYRNPKHITNEWKEKYEHVLKNPIVLHYTNRKPWDYDSQHPLKEEYFKYLDMTPWKGYRPSHSIINRCKRFFKLLPFHLGIRKAKYVKLSK